MADFFLALPLSVATETPLDTVSRADVENELLDLQSTVASTDRRPLAIVFFYVRRGASNCLCTADVVW